ncbi:MAG: flagella basal body P-ring formation protein FlgA [Helicobacteraceae bacterium CG2_30_36_10]|nr:MAG: flagella basal body P-ring formation protein FlgA [Helicobacteraceae bacterium CG2_30_36_10]
MFLKTLFLLLFSLVLHANEVLKSDYYLSSDDINLSVIFPHAKQDIKLFSLERSRYTKKIKSRELIKLLEHHGYPSCTAQNRYINFIKKSPIDVTKIEEKIRKLYTQKYTAITIKTITVMPRGYIESLTDTYIVKIQRDNHLSRSGTLYVKTTDNKKIFFDYQVEAEVSVYIARKKIKRENELSLVNCKKKSIILDKFDAMPIQKLQQSMFQSKHQIREGTVITARDIEQLSIVKRDSIVSVILDEKNIAISFGAKALQDGKLDDTITIQKNNKQRLKAKVIGKNRVEIQ